MVEDREGFEAELAVDLRRGEVRAGESCRCAFAVVVGVDAAEGEGIFAGQGEVENCGAEFGREVEKRGHGWLFGLVVLRLGVFWSMGRGGQEFRALVARCGLCDVSACVRARG